MFSWEYYEIFQNTNFEKHLWTGAYNTTKQIND